MIDESIFALPGIKKALCLLTGFALLQALVIIGQAGALSSAITGLWEGGLLADQTVWAAVFLLCFVSRQIIRNFQEAYLDRYAYEQADSLREKLMAKVFSSKVPVAQTAGTGSVTTTVIEGIDQIETYLQVILPKITGILVIPTIILVVVFPLDWVSGIIMLIVFPFIVIYMMILGRSAKEKAGKQHRTFQIMSNHFIDSLRGIDTLKLFGISKQHGEAIYATSERFREATMKTIGAATLSSFVLDLFSTLSVAAVAFMLGMRLLDGTLVLFPALTILILAPEYFKPIRDFAADYHASLDGKNSLISVQKIIDAPEEGVGDRPLPLWNNDSSLAMIGIGYSYPEHRALSDISFEAKGYRRIGIVGASGSGKSTLVKVLAGLYAPDSGSIEVKDRTLDGRTLGNLNQSDWYRQIITIPQDPYIFHATLRDNLCFYHPEADEDAVDHAVQVVGLQRLVDELPDGINTMIGEGARALSGGQAQRIALARALLDTSRKILLFDEPTAHLDIETEMELKGRMLPLMQDHLVFFATHRLHWMHDMDYILVMDRGGIVEQGTLPELLALNGSFAHLASRMNRGGR